MAIEVYNTLRRKKQVFEPLDPSRVTLYVCGPTVYNYAHIGNARPAVVFDLLHRVLCLHYPQVIYARNITDIDDKIIRDSQKEGKALKEFTEPYTKAFFEDIDTLGIERVEHYPHATDYIMQMVEIVKKLVDNGLAYEVDGNYYFKIAAF